MLLDIDLAELYGVSTGRLNEQVKRNMKRFPKEFMFSLSRQEILRISQIAISSPGSKYEKLKFSKNVNAFTEHGVAMLATILKSDRAIKMSIFIIKTFVKLRQILSTHKKLAEKIRELEQKT